MHANFVADLAVVLCVAALTAVLARALRQSTVLGYLLAGLIVGPYLPIPVFADQARVEALAEFGVVLVMFALGLEFRIAKLLRVLPASGLTGLVQVGFLAWCGSSLGAALGWSRVESAFLGAGVAISSTMIVSRVFDQVEVERDVREHVFGVLIVQDVLAVLLIAALTAVAAGGGLAPGELATTLTRLAVVLLALTAGGLLVVPRFLRRVARARSREILAVVSTGVAFGLALLAQELGYSVALGAFLAGILVAESGRARSIEPLIAPLRDVFAAVFFVSIGMAVDPLAAAKSLPLTLLVFAVIVVAQLASVSVAGVLSGQGLRRSVTAGLALAPIGEFSFILAAIGIEAGVVRAELRSVLVSVAVLTAFTTPLLLRAADRIVQGIDRRLPHRVQHLLTVYEAWLERSRQADAATKGQGTPVRRATRALALDAFGLLLLLALSVTWLPDIAGWVEGRFAFPAWGASLSVAGGLLLLGLPLALALARNTLALANHLASSVLARYHDASQAPAAARLAAHTSRLMVVLVVLLAVGMPSLAVLRPLMGTPFGMALLAAALAAVALHVWRNAGAMEREYRSGAEQLAAAIARHSSHGEHRGAESGLLPGLESARSLPLPERGAAVGRTLAELNLRARTGATVVAIQRGAERVLLPTGRERLETGDVLALVGSGDAVARAHELLAD